MTCHYIYAEAQNGDMVARQVLVRETETATLYELQYLQICEDCGQENWQHCSNNWVVKGTTNRCAYCGKPRTDSPTCPGCGAPR